MNILRFAVLGVGAVLACSPAAAAAEVIQVSGTGAGIGGFAIVAAAFEKRHPDVTVRVLPSIGSTGGISAVIDGKIDVACLSRPLKEEEKKRADLVEEVYARTAFVFATRPDNAAPGWKLSEIEEIYAGRRTTWPDGSPMRLVLRPQSDTFSVYLQTLTPGMKAALDAAHRIPGVFVGATDQEAADRIESTPGSFGTTSYSLVSSERRRIKALALDGVLPTAENVAAGRYLYTLPLSVVYRRDRGAGAVKEFVAFLLSAEGRALLAQYEHLPPSPGGGTP